MNSPNRKSSAIKKTILIGGILIIFSLLFVPRGLTQIIRPEQAAALIYQKIDLPKENTYTRVETGRIDPDNTLISRFIRYHTDTKRRLTLIRLDWRFSLADYLGVNEEILPERYPGASTLTVNPVANDIKAIQSLNRGQREALVTNLVNIYNPLPRTAPNPTPTPTPNPVQSPSKPSLSKPGDADLLKP